MSGEARAQWKTAKPRNRNELTAEGKPRAEVPVITGYIRKGRPNEHVRFEEPSGWATALGVPTWLTRARNLILTGESPRLIFPVGGKAELDRFLDALESSATLRQRLEIHRFRQEIMPTLEEEASLGETRIEEIFSRLKKLGRPDIDLPPPDMVHLAPSELQGDVVDWYRSQGHGPYIYRPGEGWRAKGSGQSEETPRDEGRSEGSKPT